MADTSSSAGKRFSEDLRHIREARGISVDDIHSETQIPRTIIESFESGQLYDHPTYNRVYLRSFIKAYSDTIGVPREVALNGLDAALNGTYEDAMAVKYLSDSGEEAEAEGADAMDEPPPSGGEAEEPEAGGPSGRGGIVGPPRAVGDDEEPSIEEVSSPDANVKGVGDDDQQETEEDASAEGSSQSQAAAKDEAPSQEEELSERDEAPERDAGASAEEEVDEEAGPVEESPSSEPSMETEETDAVEDPAGEPETEDDSASASAEEDEGAADDEAEEDVKAAREKLEELSGPEALRSSPDEADDASDETTADASASSETEGPSWMQGDDGDDTAESDSSFSAEESAGEQPVGDSPDVPAGDAGETGIVGEPMAMGEGGQRAGAGPASSRPDSAAGSGTGGGFWSNANQQVYITGIGIVVVLLVLVGVGVAYFTSGGDSSEPTTSTEPPSEPDTTVAPTSADTAAAPTAADTAVAETEERPPPADVTLGDEIYLLVYATEPIAGIRIQRDDDLRRPYWIQAQSASVFPFERRAIIREQLGKAELYIQGYRYPVSPADTVGGIELTRSKLQAFVDTLRGQPASLSVSPDTIPVGGPPAEATSEADSAAETSAEEDVPADTASN